VVLAVIFVGVVAHYLNLVIGIALVLIEAVALIDCLTRRADAFPVVGTLSKNAWIGILAASLLVGIGCGLFLNQVVSIFAFAAITAAAIYLLSVRPGLRDATNGQGGW
jgi:predicted tellurium resistance membrane protein TerC